MRLPLEILVGALALLPAGAWAAGPDYGFPVRPGCIRAGENEVPLYIDDLRKGYALDELAGEAQKAYTNPKRLSRRAYFDRGRGQYVMEYKSAARGGNDRPVVLPPRFIRSIIRHVEISLERRYADAVFMSDLGHSHFFFPPAMKDALYAFPAEQYDQLYQMLVDSPAVKVLYHTAEHLELRSDPRAEAQWRYYTRNVVSDLRGGDTTAPLFAWDNDRYNTLSSLAGYESWSAGYNISANTQGCFPFQHGGKTEYFDLSWEDLPVDPNNPANAY